MFGDDFGQVMPMTLCFTVGGVDTDDLPGYWDLKKLAAAGDRDDPPLIDTNLSCWTVTRPGVVHFNAVRIPGNTLDAFELSRAEAEGRRRAESARQGLESAAQRHDRLRPNGVGKRRRRR